MTRAAQLVTDFNACDAVKTVGHDASGVVWMYHGQPNVIGADADLADTKTKKPTTENSNWLMGYKPQSDGSWKITWSTMSDTPPAAPAAPAPKT